MEGRQYQIHVQEIWGFQKEITKQNVFLGNYTRYFLFWKTGTSKIDYEKNKIHQDKYLGPANTDKSDVINECKRQLFDVATYVKKWKLFCEKVLQNFEWLSNTISIWESVLKKRKRVSVIQRFQLCNATLLHYLENS